MATQQVVLCDSNIFIILFKGDIIIKKALDKIGNEQISCSVISYSEIIYGTKKTYLPGIKRYFDSVRLIPPSEKISKEFIGISLNYSYNHHIKIPDALIAATAITYGIPLFTLNKKDFDFIPEVKFHLSWNIHPARNRCFACSFYSGVSYPKGGQDEIKLKEQGEGCSCKY